MRRISNAYILERVDKLTETQTEINRSIYRIEALINGIVQNFQYDATKHESDKIAFEAIQAMRADLGLDPIK